VALRPQTDALRGSLDLLVLKTLSLDATHGWGISQRIHAACSATSSRAGAVSRPGSKPSCARR